MRADDPQPLIDESRALGMSDETIYLRLTLQGWSPGVVNDALAKPSHKVIHKSKGAKVKKSHARSYSKLTATVMVLAVVFAGISMYALYRPPIVYSISLPASSVSATSTITYGALPALSNPDYYNSVKETFIKQHVSFIVADLSTMRLNVYVDGVSQLEVPILAKGKPGSWWETPVGVYKIQSKERDHFSSFGKVYQPYSLDFQGNFFIHGWPYYPDGTAVSSSYSGGCIRLATENAKSVYELASVGMPVVVYDKIESGDSYHYLAQPPKISASEYLVADVKNGTVLTSSDAQAAVPIASITKLVTALVAIEYLNLDAKVTVTADMVIQTTVPRLKVGQVVSVHDLLILLLTESSNQAAEALAGAVGHERFIQLMNTKAASIGLSQTSFADPSGLSELDISTPEDLFSLLKYILENRRFVFDITNGTLKNDAYGSSIFSGIENFNFTPGVTNQFLGGKVGNTDEAHQTFAGIFALPTDAGERSVAVIVLGSSDEHGDTRTLMQFVNKTYGATLKK
jgi:D-alanyl-D-alanine carboxypeptidase